MHINTESENYKRVRNALSWVEYAGGCAAVDSVLIPFIYTLYQKKLRWMRPIAMLGTLGISIAGGYLSRGILDDHFDAVVELINAKDAEKKQNSEKEYVDWRKPSKTHEECVEYSEDARIHGQVVACNLFLFSSEEDVRFVASGLASEIIRNGYATLDSLIKLRKGLHMKYREDDDYDIIENPDFFGWSTKLHNTEVAFEKIDDQQWILDMLKFDYLPEAVNHFKAEDMKDLEINDIQDKEDKEK